MSKQTTNTAPVRVHSPAQVQAIIIRGRRWNLASILAGVFCLITLIPFVGLGLGIWFVRKARSYGHKAPIGVVLIWINAVATVAYILTVVRLLDVVFNGANPAG